MAPSLLQSPGSGSGRREGQCLGLGSCLGVWGACAQRGLRAPLCPDLGVALDLQVTWVVTGLPSFHEDTPLWCGLMGLALGKAAGHWLPW